MNLLDVLINIAEGLLYGVLIGSFIEVDRSERIEYLLLFVFVYTIEVTLANWFSLYEGLYILIYIITYYLLMKQFSGGEIHNSQESNFIFAVNFDGLIVGGQELLFLISFLFFHKTPLEIAENYSVPAFVVSRLFLILGALIVIKMTESSKKLCTRYDKYFIGVFLIIFIIRTLIEGQIFTSTEHLLLLIVVNLAITFISLVMYFIFCRFASEQFAENTKQVLAMELSGIRNQSDLFKRKEKELRIIKHDLINQFSVLDGFLSRGEIENCRYAIHEYINAVDNVPVFTDSGYTAIDTILSIKLNNAKDSGIKTSTLIEKTKLTENQELDIAIILANLIDNAVENIASEKKEISVKMMKKRNYIIQVQNTTDAVEIPQQTRKTDRDNHGFGLDSVRLLANKYNGELFLELEGSLFTAIVSVQL